MSIKFLPALLPLFLCFSPLVGQVTLVKGAPNQDFNLSCDSCSMTVEQVLLQRGRRLVTYSKTPKPNLLDWKYYDAILRQDVTTSSELPWEKCTQLIDAVSDQDTLLLQVVLTWKDSVAQTQRLHLFLAGLHKSDLADLPLHGEFLPGDADDVPRRFAAIAQVRDADGRTETYDATAGEITLTQFDAKTGAIAGTFSFTAKCVGLVKLGEFREGQFQRR